MRNIAGQVVTGKDFFERPELQTLIWERIPVSNLLLTAPRRSGKTSIMLRLRDEPKQGYVGVFVNVEGHAGAGQMIRHILSTLQETPAFSSVATGILDNFKRLLPQEVKVETPIGPLALRSEIESHWEQVGELLLKRLKEVGAADKKGQTPKLLLLIDEFPVMLERLRKKGSEGQHEALQLLHWFRCLRIDPAFADGRVRFVLSGSIGLEGVVSRMNASKAINDLENISVEPLRPPEAKRLLATLDPQGSVLKDTAVEALLSYLEEPYPYYLQLFYYQAHKRSRERTRPCEKADIDELYQQELLGLTGQTALRHMDERLHDALNELEAEAIRSLLDKVANARKGVSPSDAERILSGQAQGEQALSSRRSDARVSSAPAESMGAWVRLDFHALRQLLLHDGYLKQHEGRLYFRTQLLKDFWLSHRGLRRSRR